MTRVNRNMYSKTAAGRQAELLTCFLSGWRRPYPPTPHHSRHKHKAHPSLARMSNAFQLLDASNNNPINYKMCSA